MCRSFNSLILVCGLLLLNSGCSLTRGTFAKSSGPPTQSEPDVAFESQDKSSTSKSSGQTEPGFDAEQTEPGTKSRQPSRFANLLRPDKALKKVIPLPRTDQNSGGMAKSRASSELDDLGEPEPGDQSDDPELTVDAESRDGDWSIGGM